MPAVRRAPRAAHRISPVRAPRKRAGSKSAGGPSSRPSTRLATIRAEAGPSEIPQGPWPAATKTPSRPGARPSSGSPSADSGRAHARTGPIGVRASAGTNRAPRSRSRGASAAASGRAGRNVEPSADTAPAVTRLKSGGGSPRATSSSMPASSSACRGGASSRTSATTPQSGAIGRHSPAGSTSAGVHGPAATTTAPAGRWTPPTVSPPAASAASAPVSSRAPAAAARPANARVAADGPTGYPVCSRTPVRSDASAGSSRAGPPAPSASARSSGNAASAACSRSPAPSTSTPAGSAGNSKPWSASSP